MQRAPGALLWCRSRSMARASGWAHRCVKARVSCWGGWRFLLRFTSARAAPRRRAPGALGVRELLGGGGWRSRAIDARSRHSSFESGRCAVIARSWLASRLLLGPRSRRRGREAAGSAHRRLGEAACDAGVHEAVINEHRDVVHAACGGAAQEHEHARHLLGRERLDARVLAVVLAEAQPNVRVGARERRVGRARLDGVDADAALRRDRGAYSARSSAR